MKIITNEHTVIDLRGQLSLTGTIKDVNCITVMVAIREGIKHMEDIISNPENDLPKHMLADLINDTKEIYQKIVEANSRAFNAGLMETMLMGKICGNN